LRIRIARGFWTSRFGIALLSAALLLFLAAATSVMPVVACYYALATATANVLGYDVRGFPSPAFRRLVRLGLVLVSVPIVLPVRGLARLFPRRQTALMHDEPNQEERASRDGDREEALESNYK